MSYKLRMVQKFKLEHAKEFMAIEKQFAEFENKYDEVPKGKRYIPLCSHNPSNTLIWECDFDTMEALQKVHAFLLTDKCHDDLFQKQSKYMLETYTEIYLPYDV